ncbi:outer membrane protein assembly factor BamB family protein [Aporhodopirellula aestuarii]|uniref:PQQ-binding-like beta-propeller repeat protein n=1 Tax=Aporhodopirellula aestuarii TaxID=2950107 RepID=A0ABT0UCE2_9BACT|nr:PQQ-binding-like beta-propeller repeat protein [Aporhodopirellula aestuarii]MCM2374549.1 PQQ-binding-like beta-propeller repeat protein [Aporhodopirellula aestuarii]
MHALPRMTIAIIATALAIPAAGGDHWPENRGPNHNDHLNSETVYPTRWSVATNENIRWVMPLPETGQSGIAVWNDKLFLTCFRKLSAEDISPKGTWVSETRGYCLDADSGEILWSCDLPGKRPNQVNGTFTDSTTPTPVTDGNHVWFVNAGGYMACHTLDGQRVWGREFEVRTKHSAKQFQPFLHDGNLYYAMMRDASDPERRPQTAKDYDKNSKTGWPWMYVRCFDALTGQPTAVIPDGISVHSKGALGSVHGETVLLHAKGGSHSPPEKPYGLGLSRLDAAHDLNWERPGLYFEGTHFIDDKHAYCFDKNDFFVLDLATGETIKQIRVRDTGSIVAFDETSGRYKPSAPAPKVKSPHLQTHRTNIGVGKYHFFMSGQPGVLGRINIETAEVNYLQVPIQVVVENGKRTFSWTEFQSGDTTGSGFQVEGDKRRLGHGFGHISAATPIVVNDHIYFCTVLGTVYVIDATADQFDEHALVAVNDLGLPGETWTLSPFTAANGHLYQRTSKEIICIGDQR